MFSTAKFGGELCRLRRGSDMTQSALAEKIGVSARAIGSYELGESFPDMPELILLAQTFGTTVRDLLAAGEPTPGELDILLGAAEGRDAGSHSIEDITGVAPYLRPSVLEKLVDNFSAHGIDISYVVKLSEYLNDKSVLALLEKSSADKLDEEILGKFVPILDEWSKYAIICRILDGELDYHFLRVLLPYASEYIDSQVEEAVLEGAIPWDALELLHDALDERRALGLEKHNRQRS